MTTNSSSDIVTTPNIEVMVILREEVYSSFRHCLWKRTGCNRRHGEKLVIQGIKVLGNFRKLMVHMMVPFERLASALVHLFKNRLKLSNHFCHLFHGPLFEFLRELPLILFDVEP